MPPTPDVPSANPLCIDNFPLSAPTKSLLRSRGIEALFDIQAQCLAPGEAAVVFGGVVGAGPWPAGVTTVRAQARLGLSNSAGSVALRSVDGALLGRFVYSDSEAQSYTLWPELVGVELIPHEQAAPGRLFSPGTCADGSPLVDGCPQPSHTDEGDMSTLDSSD